MDTVSAAWRWPRAEAATPLTCSWGSVRWRTSVGITDGPIVSRISGNWSRCSLVSVGIDLKEARSGPIATLP